MKESNRIINTVSLWQSLFNTSVCTLTWCRWGVQVHLLTVLPVARLVAASHSQHVHTVHLQPVNHSAAPNHFIQSLPAPAGGGQSSSDPASRCSSWYHTSAAILNGEVPGGCRVLGQSPAQEELVVGQGTLGINHWSQGGCDKNRFCCGVYTNSSTCHSCANFFTSITGQYSFAIFYLAFIRQLQVRLESHQKRTAVFFFFSSLPFLIVFPSTICIPTLSFPPPFLSSLPFSPWMKFSSVRSLSSLETSSWKCLKDGSASRVKCWRFSIALLNLVPWKKTGKGASEE